MADTDSLDLDMLESEAEQYNGLDEAESLALIAELRGLRSQLAEKDATVAHEDRSADEAVRRLRTLSSSACPGCKGTHYKDIDTVAAEIASLRSQLAESQRENERHQDRERELESALRITTRDLEKALDWMCDHDEDEDDPPHLMEPGVQTVRNRLLLGMQKRSQELSS